MRDSLRRDLVHRSLPLLESGDVGERRLSDALQRFFGEETLMAGDDDIGKGAQTRENIVTDDLIRQIFEEEIGLFSAPAFSQDILLDLAPLIETVPKLGYRIVARANATGRSSNSLKRSRWT
jgi:hypothetical protein